MQVVYSDEKYACDLFALLMNIPLINLDVHDVHYTCCMNFLCLLKFHFHFVLTVLCLSSVHNFIVEWLIKLLVMF